MRKTITRAAVLGGILALGASVGSAQEASEIPTGFRISPGTTLTFYGFVRAEAFYDFDRDQGDLSQIGSLDTLQETDGAFNTSVRVSRLGFRLASQTDIGEIGGQLEYDLFGSNGTAELRLRHANITLNNWLFGQFWTNFMPIGQYPTTSDFNGPVGISFARVPQIRYTGGTDTVVYSFSIEESAGSSEDPIVTAALQYNADRFTGRIAALAGTAQQGGVEDDINGVTLAASFQPWAGGTFNATYVNGDGIGSYLIGGGDDLFGGDALGVEGYTLELRQQVSDKWNIGVAYGFENYDGGVVGGIDDVESLHINAFYNPTDRITVGLEYIYGERAAIDGGSVDAERIGTSITFRF